ncbi:Spo0E family sporulation regulatory protein-aspartic acid phosphatase [Paenibacillus sedimenti]|uniref:Aspartyl-phosphate phosphatase Spo0E family protein n=1 Tax=Paenibacillus sedimenti TaxID=2770274 RepID=A0A926QNL2_9BACL|nr:Spo0E family sporulation regulatory protein-aspartic acid phosphatase [Paenibacillus sedimenti]MBD0384489.1 aspartyl-phosphate phosphatase Spo0E family protein [Paenibacillus sedimenti]
MKNDEKQINELSHLIEKNRIKMVKAVENSQSFLSPKVYRLSMKLDRLHMLYEKLKGNPPPS